MSAPGGTKTAQRLGFTGFPREAFVFFAQLARNNNRDWFLGHKEVFEEACLGPLKALTQALDPPFGAARITRIYRDIRFSKDKSPYRTHISTVVRGNYLGLSAEGLWVGTGLYMPEAAALRRLRDAISDDVSGTSFVVLASALRRKGYEVDSHEVVASAPRGFRADHPRLEFLRMKDVYAGKMIPSSALVSSAAVGRVQRACTEVAPLRRWLERYVI